MDELPKRNADEPREDVCIYCGNVAVIDPETELCKTCNDEIKSEKDRLYDDDDEKEETWDES